MCKKINSSYSKTCVKRPLSKRLKMIFKTDYRLMQVKQYCRMIERGHSAILSTCIKLSVVIKIFVLSIFERPFYTGVTVLKQLIDVTNVF